MIATPLVPGHAYRVRGPGLDLTVLASNGCAAICNVIARVWPCAA